MDTGFKTLDQLFQDGTLYQLVEEAKKPLVEILETIDRTTLQLAGGSNDLAIVQGIICIIALAMVSITFLPFGATTASIQACQINTNQKLLKTGGVVIVVMTSMSAIFFLQILKLSELINSI